MGRSHLLVVEVELVVLRALEEVGEAGDFLTADALDALILEDIVKVRDGIVVDFLGEVEITVFQVASLVYGQTEEGCGLL